MEILFKALNVHSNFRKYIKVFFCVKTESSWYIRRTYINEKITYHKNLIKIKIAVREYYGARVCGEWVVNYSFFCKLPLQLLPPKNHIHSTYIQRCVRVPIYAYVYICVCSEYVRIEENQFFLSFSYKHRKYTTHTWKFRTCSRVYIMYMRYIYDLCIIVYILTVLYRLDDEKFKDFPSSFKICRTLLRHIVNGGGKRKK